MEPLCFLSVPEAVQLFECEAGDTLGDGALVTDQQLCNALVQEVAQCEDGPLQGVFVDPADAGTTCNLEDVVTNCPMSVDNPMGGQLVTTVLLCNAPVDAEKCPAQNDDGSPTDLPGVYTMMPSQCNIDYPVCDSTTPLGIALDLGVTEEVQVADDIICQLDIPILMECIDSGFLVNNPANCPQKCPDGRYVMQGMNCAPLPPDLGQLTIIKNFNGCVDNQNNTINCPSQDLDSANDFTIDVSGNAVNPSSTFAGSEAGTVVTMEPGQFDVTESLTNQLTEITSPAPPECNNVIGGPFDAGADIGNGQFICSTFDLDCVGNCTTFADSCSNNMMANDEFTCNIDNTILVQTNLMIQKDWFVCDNLLLETNLTNLETPYADCTTIERNFETVDSGNYLECTADQDCQFIQDTGLDILISGNSPTPNVIPAFVGTQETVDIDAGMFNITESLSNQSIPLSFDFVGNNPIGIAHDPVNERMYAASIFGVSAIDTNTNTVVGSPINAGSDHEGIAHDPVNERMYVTRSNSIFVSVIDTSTNMVSDTITVGNNPIGIAHDPVNERMYVTNSGSNSVSVIDTSTNMVSDTITVGNNPIGIAHDSCK